MTATLGTGVNRLSIDPGVSTGMAMRLNGEFSVWIVERGNSKEVIEYIRPQLDEVIYERFASSMRTDHYGLLTIELCGAIQAGVWTVNRYTERDWNLDYAMYTLNRDNGEPAPYKQIELVRQEPQNRLAFVEEAQHMVLQYFKDLGAKPDSQVMDDGVSATAHLLCREQLGDDVRKRKYGLGISNA